MTSPNHIDGGHVASKPQTSSSMSIVELRVELPAYAHSFVVTVPESCSILEVKQEIFRTCIGGPRIEGQRIIWRGRYLLDQEKVEEIWKSIDEPHIIHLAVHPSAWTSTPPEIPQVAPVPSIPPMPLEQPPTPRPYQNHQSFPAAQPQPLSYIIYLHRNALLVLTGGKIEQSSEPMGISRARAVQIVERQGWSWPTILDDEFPPAADGGLRYERVSLDGQQYLQLRNPSALPTPIQAHALQVLSYTFVLININVSRTTTSHTLPSQSVPIPPNVNALLQQLGLPHPRIPPAANPNQNPILPELRELPIRPLLAPLFLLIFRTMLLLYFVAPARKPIFGILILAWMLYEIWQPIRNGMMRGWRHAVADNQQHQDVNLRQNLNPDQGANGGPGQRPPAGGPGGTPANRDQNHVGPLLDTLGNQNIQAEEQLLSDTPGTEPREPSLGHKALTFCSLLFTTLHPAVWNRRRVALRSREGRIRTEAHARERIDSDGDEGSENETRARARAELIAQHARRPQWIRNYIDRVMVGDWVDDSD
ncbi:hypothetical protein BD779DRAFT_1490613 [Infundibulicybe gibba]|nr:hypothetical protein BD779DRAFT_1490613 [Infundibulicybe gibba]